MKFLCEQVAGKGGIRGIPKHLPNTSFKGRAILCIALNPQSGDFSGAILEVPFKAFFTKEKVVLNEINSK